MTCGHGHGTTLKPIQYIHRGCQGYMNMKLWQQGNEGIGLKADYDSLAITHLIKARSINAYDRFLAWYSVMYLYIYQIILISVYI